jgi:hypothetical protein
MMMFRVILAFVLISTATNAYALDETRNQKIQGLMKLQGLYEMIEQQKQAGQEQAKSIGSNMIKQVAEKLPELGSTVGKDLQLAYEHFVEMCKPSWTTEEAVNVFADLYGKNLSNKELDEIIVYYKSAAGQKDVQSTKLALPLWIKFFRDKNEIVLEKATQAYIAELRQILDKVKDIE